MERFLAGTPKERWESLSESGKMMGNELAFPLVQTVLQGADSALHFLHHAAQGIHIGAVAVCAFR